MSAPPPDHDASAAATESAARVRANRPHTGLVIVIAAEWTPDGRGIHFNGCAWGQNTPMMKLASAIADGALRALEDSLKRHGGELAGAASPPPGAVLN